MQTENRDFDKEAALWDENPARLRLADSIAAAIQQQVSLRPDMKVMDFGCGTGLLTLRLQPFVKSLTGVDSSEGMLAVLGKKVTALKLDNVTTSLVDPAADALPGGSYDLIVSNMTLHHVAEIDPLFAQFAAILAQGGQLCIADLDPDDGLFHPDSTGVFHNGFSREFMRDTFARAGFGEIKDSTGAEVTRPDLTGTMRKFSIFLVSGRKR